ncbi:hypothetical protein V4B17_01770 [Bartonella sp. B23]
MADCITKYDIDKVLTLARHYQTDFPKNALILSISSKIAPADTVDEADEMD